MTHLESVEAELERVKQQLAKREAAIAEYERLLQTAHKQRDHAQNQFIALRDRWEKTEKRNHHETK